MDLYLFALNHRWVKITSQNLCSPFMVLLHFVVVWERPFYPFQYRYLRNGTSFNDFPSAKEEFQWIWMNKSRDYANDCSITEPNYHPNTINILFASLPISFKLFELGDISLTHWARVTHICVSKCTIIGSYNSLSPGRRQAIILTNAGMLPIAPSGTNFGEIFIEIQIFASKKTHLKVLPAKCRPFCLDLNVLTWLSSMTGL